VSECCEETQENHEDICDNGNEDVGSVQAGEEGQVEEEEWGGNAPVDVTGPEDLSVDVHGDIWGVLVDGLYDGVREGVSITGGHGEVGDGREGGDQSSEDVEKPLLDWGLVCHPVECEGGEEHDDEDDPEGLLSGIFNDLKVRRSWDHRWKSSGRRLAGRGRSREEQRRGCRLESFDRINHIYVCIPDLL